MKALLPLFLFCLFCNSVHAQITQGKMSVGANLSADYSKHTDRYLYATPTYEVDIWDWELVANPYFQYFVKDNLGIGLGLNYSIDQKIEDGPPLPKNGYTTMNRDSEHWFKLDLLLTKYWFVGAKLALYLQPKISPGYFMLTYYREIDNPSYTTEENETIWYSGTWQHKANLSFGLSYFIAPKIVLQSQIEVAQYTYTKYYQTGGFLKSQPHFMFGMNYVFH